ncbi:uncharacterized protein [Linepithema humile]|uniref:uncharacterized protein n=1 Tax=Linepithema humile TaxID=83485 RepID=UPI00351E5304
MDMADQTGTRLPSQGIRTPRDRRGGSPVPAPATSSSSDGLTTRCSPSLVANRVIGSVATMFSQGERLFSNRSMEFTIDLYGTFCFMADKLGCGKKHCHCNTDMAWKTYKSLGPGGRSTFRITRKEMADSIFRVWSRYELRRRVVVPEKWKRKKIRSTYRQACVVLVAAAELLGSDLKQKEEVNRAMEYLRKLGKPYEYGHLGRETPEKADNTPLRLRGGIGPPVFKEGMRKSRTLSALHGSDSSDSDHAPRMTSLERLAPGTITVKKGSAPEEEKKKEDEESDMEVVEVGDSPEEEFTTQRPPSRAGDPGSEDSGDEAGPSRPASRISEGGENPQGPYRLPMLHRAPGRPRKDGTGPFKALSTSGTEGSGKGLTRKKGKNLPYKEEDVETEGSSMLMVRPPPLTCEQRGKVEHRLRQMERGSSREIVVHADKCLDEIEQARTSTTNMKGSLSGQIKVNVYLLREVLRTLSVRADKVGDPGYWRSRVNVVERDNTAYKAQNENLLRKLSKAEEAIRYLKANPPNLEGPLIRDPRSPTLGRDPMGRSDITLDMPIDPVTDMELDLEGEAPSRPSVNGGMATKILMEVDRKLSTLMTSMTDSIRRMEDRVARLEQGGRTAPGPAHADEGKRKEKKGKGKGKGKSVTAPPLLPHRRTEVLSEGDLTAEEPIPHPREMEQPWTAVVKGGRRKKGKGPQGPPLPPSTTAKKEGKTQAKKPSKGVISRAGIKRRLPRTAAVAISAPDGTYADVMKEARERINLKDLNLNSLKIRNARNGGILLEIAGEQSRMKADALAVKLKEVVADRTDEVRISRPSRRLDFRLVGLGDHSISSREDIIAAISHEGGCDGEEVRLGRVQTGGRRGLNLAWAQCPADAALKLAEVGSVQIGWAQVKVELLQSRPAQCFRCLGRGHVQQRCPSNIDRARCCYRCGEEGHSSGECRRKPHCPLCALKGLPSGHRTGSTDCPPIPPKSKEVRGIVPDETMRSQLPPLPLSSPEMETKSMLGMGEAKRPREDSSSPPQADSKKARGTGPDRPDCPDSPQPGPSTGP